MKPSLSLFLVLLSGLFYLGCETHDKVLDALIELTADKDVSTPPVKTEPVSRKIAGSEDVSGEFRIDRVDFKFHKETKKEVCGDWDYFIYNGSFKIEGVLKSGHLFNMTQAGFVLDLSTPFDTYTLEAFRDVDTLGDEAVTVQTFRSKRRATVFEVDDYKVMADDIVYRNENDDRGYLKNFGPILNAEFDLASGRFELKVSRGEFIANDMETGDEMGFQITLYSEQANKSFDGEFTYIYRGRNINSDSYLYDGDCDSFFSF